MCKGDGEDTNNLLLHCPVARLLWNVILRLFRISWVMPNSIKELLLCWSLFKRRRRNFVWETALAVCWTIWKERNGRTFDNIERSTEQLNDSLLRSLFSWCCETGDSPLPMDILLLILSIVMTWNSVVSVYTPSVQRTRHLL